MALVLLGWWWGGRGSRPPAVAEDGNDPPPAALPATEQARQAVSEEDAALAALRLRAIWRGLHIGQQEPTPPPAAPAPARSQPSPKPKPKPRPIPVAPVRPAPPAPARSDDRPRGARPYKPYDGTGRYAMAEDDGVRGIQGLATLARRYGVKPYAGLKYRDGTWQTERLVFRDVDTGATMVRLTNDLWANELSYFGRNWSADGRLVIFRRRPGSWEASTATHGPMAVRSDGTGMHNIFRDYRSVLEEACSPTDPNICFGIAEANKLVAFNLRTGKTSHVIRPIRDYWHLKVSLDGRYLMGRGNLNKGGRGLWVASADGKEYHEIAVPEAIHDSFQFHPSQKKAMFWYEDRFKEGFVQCDFDGHMAKIKYPFDWNHGDVGPAGGVHTDGYVMRIKGDEWTFPQPLFHRPGVEYYDHPTHYNGYLTWSPKDQLWVYGTRLFRRPFVSEIQAFHAEPVEGDVVNRYRICSTCVLPPATLDHPQASPDGTKVLFNSNMFGRADVFYVVARLPEIPRELTAKRDGSAIHLAWRPPAHHAEIAGYHVYRSDQSGVNFVPLTRRPVQAPQYTDDTAADGKPAIYAVTAVEHSGLESGLSAEVAADVERATKRHIFLEAEQGQRDRRMWVAHDGNASNRHYVWMRTRDGEGSVAMPLNLPDVPGPWTVWARVRGEKGVQFTGWINGEEVNLRTPARTDWTWMKFDGTLDPKPERRKGRVLVNSPSAGLRLSSSLYGSALDCVAVTNDPDFSPASTPRIRWPKIEAIRNVEARAVSPYAVKLSWPRTPSDTFHHYNLYCGRKDDFAIGQDTLVASPDRGSHLDYELEPGQTYYYRVTSVDRAGNESPPSAAVAVAMPKVERVVIKAGPGRNPVVKVPRRGLYVLWLKLKPQPGGGVYIDVAADRDSARIWTIACDCLSDEGWFTYDQWGRFTLTAGEHTLTINNRTKHLVQEVLLTNDLSYRPEGHVNMLRGW